MAPLVRRSWALRAHTPIMRQRTRSHQKVSAIAVLCVAPTRNRLQLVFRLHPDVNVNALLARAFLQQLRRYLAAPITLVWDRLRAHRARLVQRWLGATPQIAVFWFPPYAPELNPVEYVWAYLKGNPMANRALTTVEQIARTARRHGRALQHREPLLQSFVRHSGLPLRLKLH